MSYIEQRVLLSGGLEDSFSIDQFLCEHSSLYFDISRRYLLRSLNVSKVSEGAKIRNRCNQVPHLTQYTNRKVTNSQLDITNESREVSPFPAGDHKAKIIQTRT